jgi:transposase
MEVSMPPKKYHVKLSAAQRDELEKLTGSGTIKVRVYKRARILLLADEAHEDGAKSDGQIAELVDVSGPTVHRIRRRFAQEGLQAALGEKPRPGRVKKFTARQRAEITALACSDPPEGHARWSLRLLANKLVELEIVESIHHDTVREVLKKTTSSHT